MTPDPRSSAAPASRRRPSVWWSIAALAVMVGVQAVLYPAGGWNSGLVLLTGLAATSIAFTARPGR